MKTTPYFREKILQKRPYVNIELCVHTIQDPLKKETQPDGRIRYWAKIESLGNRHLRVVTLADGTIHNAFLDRNFKV